MSSRAVSRSGRARPRAFLCLACAASFVSACGGGNSAISDMPPMDAGGMDAEASCARAPGNICTIAGTGVPGDGADNLAPLDTRLYLPQDMTLGPDGVLYVVDWNNHRVRAIGADGNMHIVAGVGELGLVSDDPSSGRLNHPTGIAFNPNGPPSQMVIAAWHNSKVKTVDLASPPDTNVVDICGTGARGFGGNGGPAARAILDLPVNVAFDLAGNMLIADQANQMIRIVDRGTGIIQTMAGTGHCADAVNPAPCVLNDDGPATSAGFHFPIGQAATPGGRIAVDAAGNIYIADTENFRLRKIGTDGIIHTVAGNGTWGFAGDGAPATDAQLGRLTDVAVGPDGSLYIADTDNFCVRVVAPDGLISTFAGSCGHRGFAGDGGKAAAALLDRPYGVEVAPGGDVYIADTHNQRIRIVYH